MKKVFETEKEKNRNPLFGAFRLLLFLYRRMMQPPGSRPAEEQKRVTRTKTDDALNLGHLQTGPFKALNETNFVRNLTEAFRQLALSSSLLAPPSPVLLFLPTTTNNHKKRRTASAHLPAAPATLTLSFFEQKSLGELVTSDAAAAPQTLQRR